MGDKGTVFSSKSQVKTGVSGCSDAKAGVFSSYLFPHWFQDPMCRTIKAVLRESIKVHGPITDEDTKLFSAIKRVYGVLKRWVHGDFDEIRRNTWREIFGGDTDKGDKP